MKKPIIFILITLISCTCVDAQDCDRLFTATINYSNPELYQNGELGMQYNNYQTGVYYKIFQRTNETVNTSCSAYDIKKPIIIVEGYDIMHQENTEDIYGLYINPYNGALGDQLRTEGYDIITLNWETPQAALQLNALILEQFIDHINDIKSSVEELIIMGVSMGGVLTRYALTDMESKDQLHQTKLFISFDSPQQGAHVPLGMQAFLYNNALAGLAVPEIADLYNTYISNGTQQLVQNNFFKTTNGQTASDPRHISFYNEINTLGNCNGYPKETKNVAIANGSLKGLPNNCFGTKCPGGAALVVAFDLGITTWSRVIGSAPGDSDIWGDGKNCFLYKETPYDLNSDWYLDVGTPPYDHLPGGYFPWFKLMEDEVIAAGGSVPFSWYENSSFITTISALDLSTNHSMLDLSAYGKQTILNNSPFDDIWWDTSHDDQRHTQWSSSLSTWIHEQIESVEENNGLKSGFNNKTVTSRTIESQSELHKAVNNLTVDGNIQVVNGGNLTVLAGNNITLKPGFYATEGTTFSAKIVNISEADCTVSDNLPHLSSSSSRQIAYTPNSTPSSFLVKDTVIQNTPIKIAYSGTIQFEELEKSDKILLNTLNVYPNPFQGEINLNTDLAVIEVLIFDQKGRLIETVQIDNGTKNVNFDLSHLNGGIYYLMTKGEKELNVTKIIKK